jgi:cytochrome c5
LSHLQARKKYEADRRAQLEAEEAAARAAEARNGKWVWDESCSYYYNEVHRWVLAACVDMVSLS